MKTGLEHLVSGPVYTGEEAASLAKEALWNRAAVKLPLAVAVCHSEQDVQGAVNFAADEGVGISVLGGGSDAAGRGVLEGGVVIDVRMLCAVKMDDQANTVTIGGGATVLDLIQKLPSDRVVPTGDVSTVGVAGLTSGGGYSKLLSRYGLALDNLRAVRIVLADGSAVDADENRETDIFWAVRGGGGNFGVLTSLTLEAHRLPRVLSGMLFVPLRFAKAGLLAAQELLDGAPDALSLSMAIGSSHTGERGLVLWPFWSGVEELGERYFSLLAQIQGATIVNRKWSCYADSFNLQAEKAWGKGRYYSVSARSIERIDADAADLLVDHGASPSAPIAWIVAHDFRGAACRVRSDATAFPLRSNHLNINIVAGWEADDVSNPHVAWVEDTTAALSPRSLPGGYVNLLGPNDRQRVRDFYGEALPRLMRIKSRVDPKNLFCSNPGQL